ncbi:hypothetical protein KAU11_03825, partial [Candidatus Babeliales bacterium]|nr:hypothetical protein [Candidatus Babeliales bacterium]
AKRNLIIGGSISGGAVLLGVLGIVLGRGRALNKMSPKAQSFIKGISWTLATAGTVGGFGTLLAWSEGGYEKLLNGEDDDVGKPQSPEVIAEKMKRRKESRDFKLKEKEKQHQDDMRIRKKEKDAADNIDEDYVQSVKQLRDEYQRKLDDVTADSGQMLGLAAIKKRIAELNVIAEAGEQTHSAAAKDLAQKQTTAGENLANEISKLRDDIETERKALTAGIVDRTRTHCLRHLDEDIQNGIKKALDQMDAQFKKVRAERKSKK